MNFFFSFLLSLSMILSLTAWSDESHSLPKKVASNLIETLKAAEDLESEKLLSELTAAKDSGVNLLGKKLVIFLGRALPVIRENVQVAQELDVFSRIEVLELSDPAVIDSIRAELGNPDEQLSWVTFYLHADTSKIRNQDKLSGQQSGIFLAMMTKCDPRIFLSATTRAEAMDLHTVLKKLGRPWHGKEILK